MSQKALDWAMTRDGLSAPTKSVLFVLAHHSNGPGNYCWPGRQRIAKQAGCSPRQVTRHLKLLENQGLIRREKRFRTDGTRKSDGYFMLIDKVPLKVAPTATEGLYQVTPTSRHELKEVELEGELKDNNNGGAVVPMEWIQAKNLRRQQW